MMRFDKHELPDDILKVVLTGALDIAGASDIDAPFAAVAGSRDRVIVDFSKVTFLASIGIRILVKSARSIINRGGRLVVYGPTEDARKVLRSTGIDAIVPVVADEASAIAQFNKS